VAVVQELSRADYESKLDSLAEPLRSQMRDGDFEGVQGA